MGVSPGRIARPATGCACAFNLGPRWVTKQTGGGVTHSSRQTSGSLAGLRLNQWLQYREIGRWTDYAYGEKTYLVLSLVAKSLLAWQISAGHWRPEATGAAS